MAEQKTEPTAETFACSRLRRPGVNSATLLLVLGAASTGCNGAEPAGRPAGGEPASRPTIDSTNWAVRPDGAGPVAYGVTIAEAEAVVGDSLVARPDSGQCAFAAFRGMPPGMQFMVEHGRLVRTDVTAGTHATDRGARVGMTATEVQSLYGGTLEERPHKYDSAGRYLVFGTGGGVDSVRVVFETDGRAVTRYRAGILPAVEYVEGCG